MLEDTCPTKVLSQLLFHEASSSLSPDGDSSDDHSSIEIICSKELTGVEYTNSSKDPLGEDSSNELDFITLSFKSWINALSFLIISFFLGSS